MDEVEKEEMSMNCLPQNTNELWGQVLEAWKKFPGIGAFSENSLILCPQESGLHYVPVACGQKY